MPIAPRGFTMGANRLMIKVKTIKIKLLFYVIIFSALPEPLLHSQSAV